MTQSQKIQAVTIVDYPWRAGRWPVAASLERPAGIESALPGSSVSLPAHLSLSAGRQVSSSLHLITGNLVRGVSCCGLTHNSLSWGVPSSSIQH